MKTVRCALVVLAAWMAVLPAIPLQAAEAVTDEDLLLARNPLIIRSRLRLANEFTDVGGGGKRDKIILGGAYGFGFNGRDRNFAVAFELPFLYDNPDNAGSDWGMGDFKLRFGQLLANDPDGLRAGWFWDTEFDSADAAVRAIANQRTQMALGAGASHPLWHNFLLSSTVQYGWSLDSGETTGRKSEWEAHLTASYKLTPSVSLNLDYKAVIHTLQGATWYSTLEPSAGWTLGADKDIGVFASCELPLDETGVNWVAKAGVIWFF